MTTVENMDLIRAASEGDLTQVKALLAKGANVNFFDSMRRSPLLWAISNAPVDSEQQQSSKYYDVIEELINNSADVNLADCEGVSPLYQAARRGFAKVVTQLLECGAQQNKAQAPIYAALYELSLLPAQRRTSHWDVIQRLIQKGASIDEEKIIGYSSDIKAQLQSFSTERALRPRPY